MEIGTVKVAEDSDFKQFRQICDDSDGWNLAVNKRKTTVWTKANERSNFNMVKMQTVYDDVSAAVMYDVLHDPQYRKTWDRTMLEGEEICAINPNNDIGYYAIKCPAPLKNRDFVTQRSWLHLGDEYFIINHSVNHSKRPVKKGVIRGVSFLTGYMVRQLDTKGCQLTYISQSDPKGNLPAWMINRLTRIMAPKISTRLHKAAKKYPTWKAKNSPQLKPWLFPEQMMATLPLYDPKDLQDFKLSASCESLEEAGDLKEEDISPDQDDDED